MDAGLQALVALAERDGHSPMGIYLALVGGTMITGLLAPAAAFTTASRPVVIDQVARAGVADPAGWDATTERFWREIDRADQTGSLTLIEARVTMTGGAESLVPAVRIPGAAVQAWWLTTTG